MALADMLSVQPFCPAPSSKLCHNRSRHWRPGALDLYLRAAVHWRCQRPPKGLGTNKAVAGILTASKHARKHEARPPRVKHYSSVSIETILAYICAGVSNEVSYIKKGEKRKEKKAGIT